MSKENIMNDSVNHPTHYKFKYEVIEIARHCSFSAGNVIKYILRSPYKGKTIEDLMKALWYAEDIANSGRCPTLVFSNAFSSAHQSWEKLDYFYFYVREFPIPCKEQFAELLKEVYIYGMKSFNGARSLSSLRTKIKKLVQAIQNSDEWKAATNEYYQKQKS